MSWLPQEELKSLVDNYGYWAVGLTVGVESMGIPLPGETVLVLAAIYAATQPDLNIAYVILAAATGAIIGDNIGYFIGNRFGYPLAHRYGRYIGLSEGKLELGKTLFERYGAKVVFFGRFVALLRILAAFLAGVNRMPWHTFMLANAAGGIVWALVFGVGGYYFGKLILEFHGIMSGFIVAGAVVAILATVFVMRRLEQKLVLENQQKRQAGKGS